MSVVQMALGFIDACSEEEILQCREKALDAVRKLERVLGLPSRDMPSPTAETPSIDPLEKKSERILDSIQKNLTSILSLGRKKAKDALEQPPLFREDPRVLDARIYRGATKKTPKLMFRTSLAIRNISMDFAKFQTKKRGCSRVAEQVKWLTSNSDQTQDEATIDKFIEENHIVDSDTFKWMIISGTKMLVLEELLGSCGISTLLWRLPTWSKSLSYPALPIFLELFLHMPKYERIRRAAEDLTKWYEKCQRLYDKNITLQQAMFENHPAIPTRHLPGSMSDDNTVVSMGDTVVSTNTVWREDPLGLSGTCSCHTHR